LLSLFVDGSASSLARIDQTDVGISGALHTGLGFFGHPNAAPPDPPCGEVCPVREDRTEWQRFHVLHRSQDDLGPLCTPAALMFASGYVRDPEPTACLLAQAFQSLWLVKFYDACERSFGFDHVIRF